MSRNQPTLQSVQSPSGFFSQENYEVLLNYTRKKILEEEGELSQKADKRLQSVINHYMQEVAKLNPGKKVQELDRIVVQQTLANMESRPKKESAPAKETDRLFVNVETQLASLQKERNQVNAPSVLQTPDFRDKIEEEEIDPMVMFEKAKKQRDYIVPQAKPELVLRDDSPEYKPTKVLQQDVIIRQQDIVKYREVEYNIFVNSGDRNWITNITENRYNFSVNFNVANNSQDYPNSPAIQERFRNIVRIEAVKAITSLESLELVVKRTTGPANLTTAVVSALSYPYVALRIAELNTNGFGTNAMLDNTFAVLHHDTSWTSDTTQKNRGYVSLAPKYLKCQKVYAPTPLGSLNKISIRLEQPNGNLLSDTLDAMNVNHIVFGTDISGYVSKSSDVTSLYQNGLTANDYIFINTTKWFSRHMVAETDKILIKNYVVAATGSGTPTDAAIATFTSWINRDEGHYVVGTAYSTSGPDVLDSDNATGYLNYIIIRNRYIDPTAGATTRDYFGADLAAEKQLGKRMRTQAALTTCACLNQNHQVSIALRVICREMDNSSDIRPNNT
jgi:hypothetical protein